MRKALQAEQGKADMEQKVRSQKPVQTCIRGPHYCLCVNGIENCDEHLDLVHISMYTELQHHRKGCAFLLN